MSSSEATTAPGRSACQPGSGPSVGHSGVVRSDTPLYDALLAELVGRARRAEADAAAARAVARTLRADLVAARVEAGGARAEAEQLRDELRLVRAELAGATSWTGSTGATATAPGPGAAGTLVACVLALHAGTAGERCRGCGLVAPCPTRGLLSGELTVEQAAAEVRRRLLAQAFVSPVAPPADPRTEPQADPQTVPRATAPGAPPASGPGPEEDVPSGPIEQVAAEPGAAEPQPARLLDLTDSATRAAAVDVDDEAAVLPQSRQLPPVRELFGSNGAVGRALDVLLGPPAADR